MTRPGKGGRPAKPTSLKIVDGGHPERINRNEPVPGQSDVVPPGWLVDLDGKTPAGEQSALDVWGRLAPDLAAKGVLTAWDVEEFAAWCDAVVNHRRAAVVVAREGVIVPGAMGGMTKNPACQLVRDYADMMTKIGARFGLTPSDRAGLKIEGESAGGGAERLLS